MKPNKLIVLILFVFLMADLVYLFYPFIHALSNHSSDSSIMQDNNQRFFLACYFAFWAYVAYGGNRCTRQETYNGPRISTLRDTKRNQTIFTPRIARPTQEE